jgi:alkanesulfonate monooxygenase SsuD/methylene tetrahydromethanopterin reductase-like flavin-dependent oxidoreductase (luciferase family)
LPYYRNYWKEAGYTEEMNAIEQALAAGRIDEVPRYLTDKWLADVTLFGSATQVRDRLEAWREAGIRTPCLVPLSADGDQTTALKQVFEAFAG